MRRLPIILLFSLVLSSAERAEITNSIGMRLVRIAAGSFRMGESNAVPEELRAPLTYPSVTDLRKRFPQGDPNRFVVNFEATRHGDYDERPVHRVKISKPFCLGVFEVTNAQYEQFDPAHRAVRAKQGFSKEDDEAVIFVSWYEARAFCQWLSKKEGRTYRLPTEAEWEYAARAGTTTLYSTGDRLPKSMLKNARSAFFTGPEDVVTLKVGETPPNPWGLYDMHGNVEEWTADWYGPYLAGEQIDPVGRAEGEFRVVRGGSSGSDPYYLRSANRMGNLPEARSWLTGFRVVLGEQPGSKAVAAEGPRRFQIGVKERPEAVVTRPVDARTPHFEGPRTYVRIGRGEHGPVYATHNHDTAIAECPNGDLLAIWYTCEQERGRELAVAASRLRYGQTEWEPASLFWDTPDRNDHCPALWFDGKRTLYHFNGVAVAGKWQPLMIMMRTSTDSGATWSRGRLIAPEHGFRNMVGQPVFRTREGFLVFGADAGGGSTIWISRDQGRSWSEPGGNIRGVHAGIVQLRDGRLMALGRGQDLEGRMPMGISSDWGRSWQSRPTIWPPIGGSQRLVLLRLQEGPLLLITFVKNLKTLEAADDDVYDGRGATSMIAAVSYDEGETWPDRRVISDGKPEHGARTLDFGWTRMGPDKSEPIGYLSACQARSGMIHLISSVSHYAFNLAWVKQGQLAGEPGPVARKLARKAELAKRIDPAAGGSNERTGAWDRVAAEKGFSVEGRGQEFEIEAFVRTGMQTTSHYRLKVGAEGVEIWREGRFHKLAASDGQSHRYRLAVRDDTAVQVYRDGVLLGVADADIPIDWRQAARGKYLEWRGAVEALTFDAGGAYAQ